jgi:sugar phosphate isomerase/epimerase
MKLAISNLAVPPDADDEALRGLRSAGADGLEVALGRIAPWAELTARHVHDYRNRVADLGLETPSLQAMFFGLQSASLFGGPAEFHALAERMKKAVEFGAALDAKVAVFGAPKIRQRNGISVEEADEIGFPRLVALADICAAADIRLAIEPVPEAYGGDYLGRWREIAALVRRVDHAHLCLHLDIGCVTLGGDDIVEAIRETPGVLAHFHMAERDLSPFEAPEFAHAQAGRELSEIGYSGWLAVEMLEAKTSPLAAIQTAIDVAKRNYLDPAQSRIPQT